MPTYRYGDRKDSRRSRRHRPLSSFFGRALAVFVLILFAGGIGFGIYKGIGLVKAWVDDVMEDTQPYQEEAISPPTAGQASAETGKVKKDFSALIDAANEMTLQYDYDGAIALLKQTVSYEGSEQLQEAVSRLTAERAALVKTDISKVAQLSVRSLIADPAVAFSSASGKALSENYLTLSEFEDILRELYDNGYVLVGMHDMAHRDENGYFVSGSILLPKDKKALVLSVEDMVYYEANKGLGFADRLILNEEGEPKSELTRPDGTVDTGDYDVVPVLESFLKEHPDFSYKGARGIIALTGYDGIFGCRTAPKYGDPSDKEYKPAYSSIDVEAEREEAARIAARLKELGWEMASHSWGRINMASASLDRIKSDTARWKELVEDLTGPVDIMIFDNGADIGNWRGYGQDNEKFAYLASEGFIYFCGVELTTIPWIQFSAQTAYLRQGRVTLNGTQLVRYPSRLAPFFDAASVLDPARP